MDLTTFIVELIQKDGIAIFLILFGAWFLALRVWPFVSGVWWPAINERDKKQLSVLSQLSEAVTALKVFTEQTVGMMQQLSTILNDHGQKLTNIQIELAAIKQKTEDDKQSAPIAPE